MYKMVETSDSLCSTLHSAKNGVCNYQNQLFRKNGLSYKSCCGLHESRILLEGKSSISNNLSQYLLCYFHCEESFVQYSFKLQWYSILEPPPSSSLWLYPVRSIRIQPLQAGVLTSMTFRVRCKVHIARRNRPVSSAIDASHFMSCAYFAATPLFKAIVVYIVATCFAEDNSFFCFATITCHWFITDGTVSINVSLYSLLWVFLDIFHFVWFGSCIIHPLVRSLINPMRPN